MNNIFKSDNILFKNENDYRSVFSKKFIPSGKILLVEHAFNTKDLTVMENMINFNKELFNNLYPRDVEWSKNNSIDLIRKKIKHNCFGENEFCILNDISQFNHSKNPNAIVKFAIIPFFHFKIYIACIISIADINSDSEIFIKYNNTISFEEKNENKFENDSYFEMYPYITQMILPVIYNYMLQEKFVKIMIKHISIYYGLYHDQNILFITDNFKKYFKNEYNNNINNDTIYLWTNSLKAILYNLKF